MLGLLSFLFFKYIFISQTLSFILSSSDNFVLRSDFICITTIRPLSLIGGVLPSSHYALLPKEPVNWGHQRGNLTHPKNH